MPNECLFCRIVNGEIPSDIVYKDDDVVAFNDIDPKAPVHILVIPREHYATLQDVNEPAVIGKMVEAANKIARDIGISGKGYRLVINCNKDGGQAVYHIHLHLLGGRAMQWPPG